MTTWHAEHLKLVLFPRPDAGLQSAQAIWSTITSGVPEVYTGSGPNSMATGAYNGLRCTVQAQFGRTELTLQAIDPPENIIGAPPPIGDLDAALAQLRLLAAAFITVPATRIAVHAQSFIEIEEVAAPSFINGVVQREIFLEGETDVSYQVNHRKASAAVPGVVLNRVFRLATGLRAFVVVHLGNPDPSGTSAAGNATQIVLRQLDLNNVPTDAPLASPVALALELIDEAAKLEADGFHAL